MLVPPVCPLPCSATTFARRYSRSAAGQVGNRAWRRPRHSPGAASAPAVEVRPKCRRRPPASPGSAGVVDSHTAESRVHRWSGAHHAAVQGRHLTRIPAVAGVPGWPSRSATIDMGCGRGMIPAQKRAAALPQPGRGHRRDRPRGSPRRPLSAGAWRRSSCPATAFLRRRIAHLLMLRQVSGRPRPWQLAVAQPADTEIDDRSHPADHQQDHRNRRRLAGPVVPRGGGRSDPGGVSSLDRQRIGCAA